MKVYTFKTMDEKILVTAASREDAYGKFFRDVKTGVYPLDKIGGIIMVTDPDNGEEYPLRTTPTLLSLKLITRKTALLTIQSMLGCSILECSDILTDSMKKDSWILEKI